MKTTTIIAPILPRKHHCPDCGQKTELDAKGHEYCSACNMYVYTPREMNRAEAIKAIK